MRVIFMGTPDFAVGTLEALLAAKHEVVLVVTQPDKPKGRGKEVQFTPVKECALAHQIPVFQPVKVREEACIEQLRTYQADIMVVVAFGQILPLEILEMAPYGCVNVHASLLPKYRGAAPIQWAIIDGEAETGITTMQMDVGLDTGDMIQKVAIPITAEETGGSLHDKLALAGANLCVETLQSLETGTATFEKQGEMTTSYAKMLKKELGNINWNQSAVEIERLIRGLSPWPSAYTNWNDKVMKIWKAQAVDQEAVAEVGTIVEINKESFSVQTGNGMLQVLELQVPGKKRMNVNSFLLGNALKVGERLEQR